MKTDILKKFLGGAAIVLSLTATAFAEDIPACDRDWEYTPSAEVLKSREEFSADRFGIFIHWGIYSMFGQGEWYLNYGPLHDEYSKAAGGFYPAAFDAQQWAKAIKDAGAKYICFTTRHHDGFSMFDTAENDYNIVKATPFKRDILKELSDACRDNDLSLHLYYSHIDWGRPDYPRGRTGRTTGCDSTLVNWDSYYGFMNNQLRELLTNYGPIRAIWFDGWWDHDEDSVPFNWQLQTQYNMIHDLQKGCLVANNHHQTPFPGEDIQIFERDLPGENTAGLSGQAISRLPLETCNTMNGMWGYRIEDTNYKDSRTLIRTLVKAAGMGANLLLNIGPRPDGRLPEQALDRLKDMGEWTRRYGETLYGTVAGPFEPQSWGVATQKGNRLFLHLFDVDADEITLPVDLKVKKAVAFDDGRKIDFRHRDGKLSVKIADKPDVDDYIIELTLR